jgi:putative sterol carrier protein
MMRFLAPVIFKGMARAFRPDRAFGFSGEIEYELRINATSKKWVIRIARGKATAHTGPAEHPVVVLRMSAPTFARVSAGILAPITAVLERKVEVEGDLRLVNRLAEMFGGPSEY